jgi:hypothetical protein
VTSRAHGLCTLIRMVSAVMIDKKEHGNFVFNLLKHANSDKNLTATARSVFFWITHYLHAESRDCYAPISS